MEEQRSSPDPIYPDLSTPASAPPEPTEEEPSNHEELQQDLAKIEEEIGTLKQVLHAKEQKASELRRMLGITPLTQLKAEINKVQSSQAYQTTSAKVTELNEKVTSSEYYKKTQETLKSAGQATTNAFNAIGSSISTKFSEMKNSPTFKSFEERVEGVGTSIMSKVSGAPPDSNVEDGSAPPATAETPVTQQPHADDQLPM